MLTDREKAITLLGMRIALTMVGYPVGETFRRLRAIARESGITDELLEETRKEHQAWLKELGFDT
jgi:hypothetical protein